MIQIPCVIFAGGKSSRLGKNKALLPFGGSPTMIEFQYKRLQKIFKHIYISCKNQDFFHFQADFIEDTFDEHYAPTIGFLSAFDTLGTESLFAISVDTPFITMQEISTLVANDASEYDAVIAKTAQTIHPMCGIYHKSLYAKFQKMFQTDDHRLRKLLLQSHTKYIDFEDEQTFFNINTMQEYEIALQHYKQIN